MYILMQFKLNAQVPALHTRLYWVVNNLKECTILHAVVCKFLSERGVQVHPPYTPLPTCLEMYSVHAQISL